MKRNMEEPPGPRECRIRAARDRQIFRLFYEFREVAAGFPAPTSSR